MQINTEITTTVINANGRTVITARTYSDLRIGDNVDLVRDEVGKNLGRVQLAMDKHQAGVVNSIESLA